MKLFQSIRPKTIVIGISIFTLILVISLLASIGTGIKKLPDITVIDLNGESISLKSLQGHPVFITFWASSCGTCMAEFPELVHFYNEYSTRGLKMIGIAMPYDLPRSVVEVRQHYSVPYPLVLDSSAHATTAFGNVRNTPTSFLFDSSGNIALHTIGASDINYLKQHVDRLLKNSFKNIN